MKPISWGLGITLLYTLFAVFILGLVWGSFGQRIELVTDHYYEKELAFNEQIEKANRASTLAERLKWSIVGDSLQIRFPGNATGGSLVFLRPSDAAADVQFPVAADQDSTMRLSLSVFRKGPYRLKAEWAMPQGMFYAEQVVVVP